jgi:predicted RNase H-like nuclease (RuvC/YqgF family)
MADSQQNTLISNRKIIFMVLGIIMNIILWIFSPGSKQNQILKNQISQIQKERDSLKNNIDSLEKNYQQNITSDSIKYSQLQEINKNLTKDNENLSKSLDNLNKIRNELDSINKIKIDTVERKGDDLINSLKSKLN